MRWRKLSTSVCSVAKARTSAGARDALVQEAHDQIPVAAMTAAFHSQAAAVPIVVDEEEREDGVGDEGELPIGIEEHEQDRNDGDEVAQEVDRGPGDHGVQGAGIRDEAGDDFAGVARIVKTQRKILQMAEKVDAHVAGHAHAGALNEEVASQEDRTAPDDGKVGKAPAGSAHGTRIAGRRPHRRSDR